MTDDGGLEVPGRPTLVRHVAQREFQTLLRNRFVHLLAVGYVVIVVGLTLLSAPGGYLPAVFDLLLPHEALVPIFAFALGYRAILDDYERGELETLRTFPPEPGTYVLGVYLGRAVALVGVVLTSLSAAGAAIAMGGDGTVSTIAAHATVDTPVAFLRFAAVTVGFALVALALAILVSTVARSTRAGLAVSVALVLALVIGIDGGLVVALSGGLVSPEAVDVLVALSPNAAYRALVFGLAIAPTGATELPVATATLPATLGLLAWFVVALGVARLVVYRT